MKSIRNKGSSAPRVRRYLVLAFPVLVLAGLFIASGAWPARAAVITPEDHWKYNVYWYWDTKAMETRGLITPKVVIENETSSELQGYVADANGTRLDMYDGEQVVKVKYGYDEGIVSDWELAGWIRDGYFTIQIPDSYRDSDYVSIYIGNNQYTVDDGDVTTRNAWVSINSARIDYRLGTNLVSDGETSTSQVEVVKSTPMPGSLIDMILARFGML